MGRDLLAEKERVLEIQIEETEKIIGRYKAMRTYNERQRNWLLIIGLRDVYEKTYVLDRLLEQIINSIEVYLNNLRKEYREIKKQL